MKLKRQIIGIICLLCCAAVFGQDYIDNSNYTLVNADNGGQVKLRNSPGGSGNPGWIRDL